MDEVNTIGTIQQIVNLGGGGVVLYVAVQLFLWKRADDKSYRETLLDMTDRVVTAMAENTSAIAALTQTVTEQQEVVNRLARIEQKLDSQIVDALE